MREKENPPISSTETLKGIYGKNVLNGKVLKPSARADHLSHGIFIPAGITVP